jgi:hypothetical protein
VAADEIDRTRLHDEVDRQLSEVRAASDGLAARAGLLIAAISAIALLLGPRIDPKRHPILLWFALAVFGVAAVCAAVTLMPWLQLGPELTSLVRWMEARKTKTRRLYTTKAGILEANLRRLLVMRIFFALQAFTTAGAVVLALVYTAWR